MDTMRMLLSTHRSWEDWAVMGFGALIVISPWLTPGETAALSQTIVINTVVVGLIVCALAALEMLALEHWEEAIGFICGAWLMISPYILGYIGDGALRFWHVGLGALVALFAVMEFWQDTGPEGTEKS